MTDIVSLINDTHRAVGRRQLATGQARTVLIRRSYDAQIEDVWQACTDPGRMNRWFLPVTGDLRPGGTYQLQGNAGGRIVRCEPPRLLAVTWEYPDHPTGEVRLRLAPGAAGETVLELEHAIPTDAFPTEAHGVGPGWEPALYALDLHLRGKLPERDATEWRAGKPPAEALELIETSARLWAELVAEDESHSAPTDRTDGRK